MHKRVRELVEYGRLCGFVLDGLDGHGHYVLSHPNGERYRIASTPGDFRGDENAKADMRRISGVSPPRASAGRYRNRRPGGFSMRRALQEQEAERSRRSERAARRADAKVRAAEDDRLEREAMFAVRAEKLFERAARLRVVIEASRRSLELDPTPAVEAELRLAVEMMRQTRVEVDELRESLGLSEVCGG